MSASPTEPNDDVEKASQIPDEWEPELMGILVDTNQSMDRRNQRLIELATVSANGVPQVQQECLRHLAFGLSSNDGARFLNLATNPVLSASMRVEFLKQTLGMRPPQLGEWLSRQLSTHHEQEISTMAREYLLQASGNN